MKCVKCKRDAKNKLQSLHVCDSCFCEIIEKRVRKEIRLEKLIRKSDRILVIDDGSAEAKSAALLLPIILKELPVKITAKKMQYNLGKKISGNYNKIIVPWNADMEASAFLTTVFENKDFKNSGNFRLSGKTYIKLFMPCLASEVETYAKIKKLRFRKKIIKSMASEMLDKLETEYPEVKFSLLKSSKEINKGNSPLTHKQIN